MSGWFLFFGLLSLASGIAAGVARVHVATSTSPVSFVGAKEIQAVPIGKLVAIIVGLLVSGIMLVVVASKVRRHNQKSKSLAYAQSADGAIRDVRSACLSGVPLKRGGRVLSPSEWQRECDRADEVQRTMI